VCPVPDTTFRWKGNLKRHHQLIHLQQKPYKCDVCSESFGTKSNREVHMIVHQTEKRDLNAARGAAAAAAAGGVQGPGPQQVMQAAPPPGMGGGAMGGVMVGGGTMGAPHSAQGQGVVSLGIGNIGGMGMAPLPGQPPQVHQQLGDQGGHGIKYER
jgi:hypothetical protein